MNNFLTVAERECLLKAERHEISYKFSYKDPRKCKIIVDVDARLIVSLVEMAIYGCRVYELMSIQRPGDLLNYLWVAFVELEDELLKSLKESVDYKHRYEFDMKQPMTGLPFIYFNEKFIWQGGDTYLSDAAWREHIDSESWYLKLSSLYQLVCKLQQRLRSIDNYLLQNEIRLIDNKNHRRDFFSKVERSCKLDFTDFSVDAKSLEFYQAVAKLITKEDVQSVSCPFGGVNVWRVLVEEQLRRSHRLGLPYQEAFALYGPDSGLNDLPEDWGGYVHIPYEGMCDADVVFLPSWRVVDIERDDSKRSLARALSMEKCHYLFVPNERDLGELPCTTRKSLGSWVLYCQNSE